MTSMNVRWVFPEPASPTPSVSTPGCVFSTGFEETRLLFPFWAAPQNGIAVLLVLVNLQNLSPLQFYTKILLKVVENLRRRLHIPFEKCVGGVSIGDKHQLFIPRFPDVRISETLPYFYEYLRSREKEKSTETKGLFWCIHKIPSVLETSRGESPLLTFGTNFFSSGRGLISVDPAKLASQGTRQWAAEARLRGGAPTDS